jgi:type I restriction-modification system DNA methylase subunit/predicted type IV restriction endonuclease
MSAPSTLNELIERFRYNLDAYKSAKYNEARLRGEFINPMFEALGWDVYNRQGYAEAYKDVIHEDAIKVGGATKAPDYSFRIGGVRKYFLETKKPSVNVKEDPEPAFQLRRYAWSAKLPLSILTDFEEFAVYDCRIKPAPSDKTSAGRILYFNYEEYPDKWEEIASVFSREAILKGSFDRFVESEKKKRGTAEVDEAFLKEIESWRDSLARNIALRNPGLTERDVNFAVQLTIDRIIFLRICEDRGIEEYGRLQALLNGEHSYKRMLDLYYRADEKYNSGLFHFQSERGRPGEPDELAPELKIDDKVLKDIIKGLYYPVSPYEFSVLPVDILGHVYERFLGKVIRLTSGGRAKVEEKPEVRKAGGVYYTPKYVVDYIVKNTVGKLVDGKKPKQVEKIRILDPACGSGSFLIGAYEHLLDWHRDWYVENDPAKYMKQIYQGVGGQWYLTTAEKKKILLNNIYGVDIDAQAVEVTKLNLLLKALEGENEETIESQLKMFRERALPDLRGNIKCGNSLIGPDFYDSTQLNLLDDEERYRINAFDWEKEFEDIMKHGGFDAVIGNPPYIRIQGLKEFAPKEVEYYKQRYTASQKGNYDVYVVFVEKGLELLKDSRLLGFIMPNKFFNSNYGEPLRDIISENKYLSHVVHFGHQQVFEGATTYTCLLFLRKTLNETFNVVKVNDILKWVNGNGSEKGEINSKLISKKEWNLHVGHGADLLLRLKNDFRNLGEVADIFWVTNKCR